MPPMNLKIYNDKAVMSQLHLMTVGLFAPEGRRLEKVLEDLLIRNKAAGMDLEHYMFEGQVYAVLEYRERKHIPIRPIHQSLVPDASLLKGMKIKYYYDHKRLTQGLSILLPRCETLQDARDAIPEHLVRYAPDLQRLPRTREPGYLLKEATKTMRDQFQLIEEVTNFYAANQLIYT